MVYFKRHLKQVPLLLGPVIQISTGAILLAPFAYFVDSSSFIEWEATALFSILALALLSTICAFVLYYRIVAQSGAMALSMVTYILPIFSSILGVLFLD
jgi:drug/metabolite transporter (DMT)-like permease